MWLGLGRVGTCKYHKSSRRALVPWSLEEGEWGCWGVVKQARGVSEDGMTVRPNRWRDAEQKMGKRGVRNKVSLDRDRQRFVREGEFTC